MPDQFVAGKQSLPEKWIGALGKVVDQIKSGSTNGVIRLETKEESNKRRQRDFLKLSPHERLQWFFRLFNNHTPNNEADRDNFILRRDEL